MKEYIENSTKCMESVLPKILENKVNDNKKSQKNQIRSMRILYENGLLGKRKYTSIRNSSDISNVRDGKKRKNSKTLIMPGLKIPKIRPYKSLMTILRTTDIAEVQDLSTLAENLSIEPFLLKLADLYLELHTKSTLLHWFNEEERVFWVAVAPHSAKMIQLPVS